MEKYAGNALRQKFLDYFQTHGHTVVKSAPLVPANDPTLMFTNAGMVQFKDVFVGAESRPYTRAASAQKCMRVSGKHNDLEEVGRTARHHTFFEMLGNFSFGDYFKEEAIALATRFIFEELDMPKDRIWVTVFGGAEGIPADAEARRLWTDVGGLAPNRVLDRGMEDNFWTMGDTGPCGPCAEIYFDLRPAGSGTPTDDDFDSGRVVEFWNNVFMQFERKPGGELKPLPAPSVDTGMGLERLAAIVQGEDSNYHTDLFHELIESIAQGVGKPYRRSNSEDDVSMRVIADHARATAFLVADGIQPSNEGRGYVMRRIMRRAIRHGKRLGYEKEFFHHACNKVVATMGEAYPELREAHSLIEKVAEVEEQSFRRTLDTGLSLLEQEMESLAKAGTKTIPGPAVFKLYDTYGFPKDLTEVIASEAGFGIDEEGFAEEMEAQRERSRGGAVGEAAVADVYKQLKEELGEVRFAGYLHEDMELSAREGTWRVQEANGARYLEMETTLTALVQDGQPREEVSEGAVELVLNPTPFYGESGGQVGDRGIVEVNGTLVEVTDTVRPLEGLTVSRGRVLKGTLRRGEKVWAGYNPQVRKMTRAHHSATHLLHGALRQVLGEHVKQAGSLVDPDHLRFDFSHFEAPKPQELRAIEDDANRRVRAEHPVVTEELPFEEAKAKGAIAMFGEKYGDVVRVLTMGESVEFCGGTHVNNTRDIGMVLLTREEAVSSGVRRVEAEVGEAAVRRTRETHRKLVQALALLRGETDQPGQDPILQAVGKVARSHRELVDKVSQREAAAPVPLAEVEVPALAQEVDLEAARRVRDTWQGLVQLTNTKGSEAKEVASRIVEATPAAGEGGLLQAFASVLSANRDLERRLKTLESSQLGSRVDDLLAQTQDVGGVKVLTAQLQNVDGKALRALSNQVRDKLGSGVVGLVSENDGKVALLVAVTKDLTARFKAGNIVKELAPLIGGRGGGKPELAQAGGNDASKAGEVFDRLRQMVASG